MTPLIFAALAIAISPAQQTTASVGPKPADAGVILFSSDYYDVYTLKGHQTYGNGVGEWSCTGPRIIAPLIVVRKVSDEYPIVPDSTLQERYEREIQPIVYRKCELITEVHLDMRAQGDPSMALTTFYITRGNGGAWFATPDSLTRWSGPPFPMSLAARRDQSGTVFAALKANYRPPSLGKGVIKDSIEFAHRPPTHGAIVGELRGVIVREYIESVRNSERPIKYFTIEAPKGGAALLEAADIRQMVQRRVRDGWTGPNGNTLGGKSVSVLVGGDTIARGYSTQPEGDVFNVLLLDHDSRYAQPVNPSGLTLDTRGMQYAANLNEVYYGLFLPDEAHRGNAIVATFHNLLLLRYGLVNRNYLPAAPETEEFHSVLTENWVNRYGRTLWSDQTTFDYWTIARYMPRIREIQSSFDNYFLPRFALPLVIRDIDRLLDRHQPESPALHQLMENLHRYITGQGPATTAIDLRVSAPALKPLPVTSLTVMTVTEYLRNPYTLRSENEYDDGRTLLPQAVAAHHVVRACDSAKVCRAYWQDTAPPGWERLRTLLPREHALFDIAPARRIAPKTVRELVIQLAATVNR